MEAVEDKVGGNNCALAQKIAKQHPAAPGNPSQVSGHASYSYYNMFT